METSTPAGNQRFTPLALLIIIFLFCTHDFKEAVNHFTNLTKNGRKLNKSMYNTPKTKPHKTSWLGLVMGCYMFGSKWKYCNVKATKIRVFLSDSFGMQNLVMQHVDHSAGALIDLLQGLLRFDPSERLKAREALRHPFFIGDTRRYGYPL